MSLRLEFVSLAGRAGANRRELCRRFNISPTTGYKWLHRYGEKGVEGLHDESRRPATSPERTPEDVERAVGAVRDEHPVWGARKIRRVLLRRGWAEEQLPSPSQITAILRRHGQVRSLTSSASNEWQRFEAAEPNDLWQMDFKGHFGLMKGRCHPLTVLDDHSRYSAAVDACGDEKGQTVQQCLSVTFRRYGLPRRILCDNGSPWGSSDSEHSFTPLAAWLIRLGITPVHSRPYHPQTVGKDERFHRTLKAEVLSGRLFRDLEHCQSHFDSWRDIYNFERPHEALKMKVPAERYQPSALSFPEALPPIEYSPGDIVRKVQSHGWISFRGYHFKIPKALRGHPVALRPTTEDGTFDVFFCHMRVSRIDLRAPKP